MLHPQEIFDRSSLVRVVADKLRAELARPGGVPQSLPESPWPDDFAIGADGLGADSLQKLQLAGALNEMFHLHRSGHEDELLARRRFGDWVDIVASSWAEHAQEITFTTSGSTGAPKPCRHAVVDLIAEAADHVQHLRPQRVLSAVPSHHIYGFLFTVLLPRLAGVDVIDIGPGRPGLVPRRGDLIVSYPDHWRYLAQSWGQMPEVTGVSSTAPLPETLAQRLREGGRMRLVEIYGSSETAGIGRRETTEGPFFLLERWSGMAGWTDSGAARLIARDGRMAATPDVIEIAGPRQFRVVRRLDRAVQVGGVNVFPAHVATVLEAHPQIAAAQVRLAEDGARLKALLVPKHERVDSAALLASVRDWINVALSVPERPRSLQLVPALPRGKMGKPADWAEDGGPSLQHTDQTGNVSALPCT